jgi:hypothetical protein
LASELRWEPVRNELGDLIDLLTDELRKQSPRRWP